MLDKPFFHLGPPFEIPYLDFLSLSCGIQLMDFLPRKGIAYGYSNLDQRIS
jgi:hypothetical protein